eukprot:2281197-Rhodomonas_salina.2
MGYQLSHRDPYAKALLLGIAISNNIGGTAAIHAGTARINGCTAAIYASSASVSAGSAAKNGCDADIYGGRM